ncbi:MAG: hypothetical protein M0R32_08430 [Candidatus Cloacimonetes bacterium]|jgi:hypothetical protein|nr:hypothetical protein [Candidatus Cloacimonadota bacterium]
MKEKYMDVTIAREERFTITIQTKKEPIVYKGCTRVSEWNGLTEFRTADNEKLIIKCENDFLESIQAAFGGHLNHETKGSIILVTPSVLEAVL